MTKLLLLAELLCQQGDIPSAARLLETAHNANPADKALRRKFEEIVLQLPQEEALAFKRRQKQLALLRRSTLHHPDRWWLVFGLLLIAMLASAMPWLGGGPGLLMTTAVTSCGTMAVVITVRHWWHRWPIRAWGSVIEHDRRPLSYHLCMTAFLVFALMFSASGLFALLNALR